VTSGAPRAPLIRPSVSVVGGGWTRPARCLPGLCGWSRDGDHRHNSSSGHGASTAACGSPTARRDLLRAVPQQRPLAGIPLARPRRRRSRRMLAVRKSRERAFSSTRSAITIRRRSSRRRTDRRTGPEAVWVGSVSCAVRTVCRRAPVSARSAAQITSGDVLDACSWPGRAGPGRHRRHELQGWSGSRLRGTYSCRCQRRRRRTRPAAADHRPFRTAVNRGRHPGGR
jgi:hypothetical protein